MGCCPSQEESFEKQSLLKRTKTHSTSYSHHRGNIQGSEAQQLVGASSIVRTPISIRRLAGQNLPPRTPEFARIDPPSLPPSSFNSNPFTPARRSPAAEIAARRLELITQQFERVAIDLIAYDDAVSDIDQHDTYRDYFQEEQLLDLHYAQSVMQRLKFSSASTPPADPRLLNVVRDIVTTYEDMMRITESEPVVVEFNAVFRD